MQTRAPAYVDRAPRRPPGPELMPIGARPGPCFGSSPADSALRTAPGLPGGGAWRPPCLRSWCGPPGPADPRTRGKRRTPAPPPASVARAFGLRKDHGLPSWPHGYLSWGRRVRPCGPGPQARSGEGAWGVGWRHPLGSQPASRRCTEQRCAVPRFSVSALYFCGESCRWESKAEAGGTRGLLLQCALPLSFL